MSAMGAVRGHGRPTKRAMLAAGAACAMLLVACMAAVVPQAPSVRALGNCKPPGAAAGGWVACLTPLGSTGHLTCSSQHATSPQPPVPKHLVWAGCFLPVLCTILLLIGSARYLCGMEPRTNTPGHSRVSHMVPILMAVQKKKQLTKATSGFRTSVTKMLHRKRSHGILLGCCGITTPMKHCIYESNIARCAGSAACLWAAGLLRPESTSATGRTARGQRHQQNILVGAQCEMGHSAKARSAPKSRVFAPSGKFAAPPAEHFPHPNKPPILLLQCTAWQTATAEVGRGLCFDSALARGEGKGRGGGGEAN